MLDFYHISIIEAFQKFLKFAADDWYLVLSIDNCVQFLGAIHDLPAYKNS